MRWRKSSKIPALAPMLVFHWLSDTMLTSHWSTSRWCCPLIGRSQTSLLLGSRELPNFQVSVSCDWMTNSFCCLKRNMIPCLSSHICISCKKFRTDVRRQEKKLFVTLHTCGLEFQLHVSRILSRRFLINSINIKHEILI